MMSFFFGADEFDEEQQDAITPSLEPLVWKGKSTARTAVGGVCVRISHVEMVRNFIVRAEHGKEKEKSA